MKQRPIEILVDALRQLGAEITYVEAPGCPPLKIFGTRLKGTDVILPADVSSQYISALLLIAPTLPEGLVLTLAGQITSLPYIKMTLALLERLGIQYEMEGNRIRVHAIREIPAQTVVVESDWSSASYYYSIAALAAPGTRRRSAGSSPVSGFRAGPVARSGLSVGARNYCPSETAFTA